MSTIELRGVRQRFGGIVALAGVDLRVEAGEFFCLLGPSGCGKTTLLRAVAGLQAPEAGQIWLEGKDVTHLAPHRREVGMVFQHPSLWPHLTIAENVAFGLVERRVARAEGARRVEEALALVRLPGMGARRIQELSGGQQQRVALARAMVVRPRCLLLDEPLSNLDTRLRGELRGEVRAICRAAGLTVLYVTHDQEEALALADRAAVMEAGSICQVGTPAELYDRPASRLVAEFMGETNFMAGTVIAGGSGARGEVEVETPLGRARVPAQEGLPFTSGAAVTICLRPEQVRVRYGDGAGWAASVVSAEWLGGWSRVRVAIDGVEGVVLLAVARGEERAVVAGMECRVEVGWERAVLLAGE